MQFVVRVKWSEEDVARRVAAIIGNTHAWDRQHEGQHCPCFRDEKWQLDDGNNWFLSKVEEEVKGDYQQKYELRFRYGNSTNSQAALEGLKLFLEYTFS